METLLERTLIKLLKEKNIDMKRTLQNIKSKNSTSKGKRQKRSDELILLTFAHRGEAQIFIREWRATPTPFFFEGLLKFEGGYILITGEGLYNALEKTSAVLGYFSEKFKEVWNLGVAGALNPAIELEKIYPLRTFYALSSMKGVEFQSFTSAWEGALTDCISSSQRILREKIADFADHFAPLIDREGWAIARASEAFKIPFFSAKITSDRCVGEKQNLAERVRAKASFWSDQLYHFFLSSRPYGHETKNTKRTWKGATPKYEWEGLYFTVTTERKLQGLMEIILPKFSSLQEIENKVNLEGLQKTSLLPKQRAKKFLHALENLLHPVPNKIENV